MILSIQLLSILFSLFMIYLTILYRKKNVFSFLDEIFWLFIWTCLLFASILPHILSSVVQSLNIMGTFDLITTIAFVLVFSVSFFNYIKMRQGQRAMEQLVRKIAIKNPRTSK